MTLQITDSLKPQVVEQPVNNRSSSEILADQVASNIFKEATPLTIKRIYESPSLSGPVPKRPTLSPDGTRALFLRAKQEKENQYDLWEYNLITHQKKCLVDSESLLTKPEFLSEEEKSQRERMRLFDHGIVDYHWSYDGKSILFGLGGKIYYLSLEEFQSEPTPFPIPDSPPPFDVKFSPTGRYITYIREKNLYRFDTESFKESQLTYDGLKTVSNGMADFIAQEEMGRYTGYWWSPDESKIAYVQVDEKYVPKVERYEIDGEGEIISRKQRYPFAGSENVKFKIGVIDFESHQTTWLPSLTTKECYLARVNWLPNSKEIAVQLLHRDQKQLDLFFINTQTKKKRLLIKEPDPHWVNLHDDLLFTKEGFIWSSERSGFRHLYYYDYKGFLNTTLTQGNSSVKRVVAANDNTLFFEAFFKNPLEKHLYSISLNGENLTQITKKPGWHTITMSSDCKHYIDTFSSITTPEQTSLHTTEGKKITYLEQNKLDETHPYFPYLFHYSAPEFGTVKAEDGQTLYYRLTKPSQLDPNKKYPVIVTTYGGPCHRLVSNKWQDRTGYWEQVMANKGFIIFTLDNRGSSDRGKKFESPIYKKLGHVEVQDQKTGVEYLRTLPYVDPENIGVFGWSYGGYMTLMTMFKAHTFFKAGVAVAPVTRWEDYDTCYTERFLETPKTNPEGYKQSSVFSQIHRKAGPILLVHGMADDNVLFTNTVKLIKKMQEAQISFDLMTYPGSKHSIIERSARIHLFSKISEFFHTHLK